MIKTRDIWTSNHTRHSDRTFGLAHVWLVFLKWTCVSQQNGRRKFPAEHKNNVKMCLPPRCWEACNCCKAAYSWKATYDTGLVSCILEFRPAASPARCQIARAWSHMPGYVETWGKEGASLQFFQKRTSREFKSLFGVARHLEYPLRPVQHIGVEAVARPSHLCKGIPMHRKTAFILKRDPDDIKLYPSNIRGMKTSWFLA